jgi:hypothetical protein
MAGPGEGEVDAEGDVIPAAAGAANVDVGVERAAPGRARAALALGGGLTLVYVVASALDLIVLGLDPVRYNALHRAADGLVPRLLVALVGFAVVFHAADSVGRAAADLHPAWDRHRARIDAAGRFVALTAGIPVAIAIVWPAVVTWWVR